jgi:hypothetical protein
MTSRKRERPRPVRTLILTVTIASEDLATSGRGPDEAVGKKELRENISLLELETTDFGEAIGKLRKVADAIRSPEKSPKGFK